MDARHNGRAMRRVSQYARRTAKIAVDTGRASFSTVFPHPNRCKALKNSAYFMPPVRLLDEHTRAATFRRYDGVRTRLKSPV